MARRFAAAIAVRHRMRKTEQRGNEKVEMHSKGVEKSEVLNSIGEVEMQKWAMTQGRKDP